MTGPERRLIKSQGREYTVRNASRSGSDRDVPTYSDDGTLIGVLEQRGLPVTRTDSAGTDIESDLEIRAVDIGPDMVDQGASDWPTKLVHPDGRTFDVLATTPEDSGVTVLTVMRA